MPHPPSVHGGQPAHIAEVAHSGQLRLGRRDLLRHGDSSLSAPLHGSSAGALRRYDMDSWGNEASATSGPTCTVATGRGAYSRMIQEIGVAYLTERQPLPTVA
ncbi:hypothetical protein GCM10023336_38130 [Streptomyces similanensis]|uniref:Uncharacterized protein n=1 Tax=Streptomyces similanensis TaxID=1274988 RepID=A0ABP9KQT0_9ACTN